MDKQSCIMKFNAGDTFHIWKGPGKPYKAHVLTTVDEHMVVYKWYGRHKQRWNYEVEDREALRRMIEWTERGDYG